MCIALISTAHPTFPLIILSNRDEFLTRPTATAHWWQKPLEHVLGGRDLQREEKGTWLAITTDGRIAVLTNFRDEGQEVAKDKSRGGIVKAYVASPPGSGESDEEFARRLIEDVGVNDVGGFSLVFGRLSPRGQGSLGKLSVLSNRSKDAAELAKIADEVGQTYGLSNSHFGDLTWPKVVHGERLLTQTIGASVSRNDTPERLIESLFGVLSIDTMPRKKPDEDWNTYSRQLRNSVMIPAVGGDAVESRCGDEIATANGTSSPDPHDVKVGEGIYGTQKQTAILVDRAGKVTFVERSLFDDSAKRLAEDEGFRRFDFTIEG